MVKIVLHSHASAPPLFAPNQFAGVMQRIPSREAFLHAIVSDVVGGRIVTPIRGASGAGKTTILRDVASLLRSNSRIVVFPGNDAMAPMDIQRAIAETIGLALDPMPTPQAVFQHLVGEGQPRYLTLALDDADKLPSNTFQYLSLLLDLARFGSVKLQLIVFGALGPWPGLMKTDLEALRQDMFSLNIVYPLTDAEALIYVRGKFLGAVHPYKLGRAAMRNILDQAMGIPAHLDELVQKALVSKLTSNSAESFPRYIPLVFRRTGPSWPYLAVAASVLMATLIAGNLIVQWKQASVFVTSRQGIADRLLAMLFPAPPPSFAGPPHLPQQAGIGMEQLKGVEAVQEMNGATAPSSIQPADEPAPHLLATSSSTGSPETGALVSPAPVTFYSGPLILAPSGSAPPEVDRMPLPPIVATAEQPAPATILSESNATWSSVEKDRRRSGLIFVAQRGDTLLNLYLRVYRGLTPPHYAEVLTINRQPIKPGDLIVFPEPPHGWPSSNAVVRTPGSAD